MPSSTPHQPPQRPFAFAPGRIFLNHAAFAPISSPGLAAIAKYAESYAELKFSDDIDGETFRLLLEAKRRFAQLVGQSSERIAFAPNTSFGLNMILWGLTLKPGERILIPEVEFPALVYVVQQIAEQRDLKIEKLPCPDRYLSLEVLENALRRKAAVLAISWVQFFNGYRYDLEQMTALCHAHGCFVLADVIQGAGAVPMEMQSWGVDAIACGAQKWLLGEAGGGFFAVAQDPIRQVRPPFASWLGRDWDYRFGDLQRWDRPVYTDGRAWEVGSYPPHAVRVTAAGINLLADYGAPAVFGQIEALTNRLVVGLDGSCYQTERFPAEINRAGIVTIYGPQTDSLIAALQEQGFFLAYREERIRVSPHYYNTFDEIDALVEAIWAYEKKHHPRLDRRTHT